MNDETFPETVAQGPLFTEFKLGSVHFKFTEPEGQREGRRALSVMASAAEKYTKWIKWENGEGEMTDPPMSESLGMIDDFLDALFVVLKVNKKMQKVIEDSAKGPNITAVFTEVTQMLRRPLFGSSPTTEVEPEEVTETPVEEPETQEPVAEILEETLESEPEPIT